MEDQQTNLHRPKPILIALQPKIVIYPDSSASIDSSDLSKALVLELEENCVGQDRNLANLQELFANLKENKPKPQVKPNFFPSEVTNQTANQAVDFLTDSRKKVMLRNAMKEIKAKTTSTAPKKPQKVKAASNSSKKYPQISAADGDRVARTILNAIEKSDEFTIDEKIDAILAKKNSLPEIFKSPSVEDDLPRKKVKKSSDPSDEGSENTNGRVNALERMLARDQKQQKQKVKKEVELKREEEDSTEAKMSRKNEESGMNVKIEGANFVRFPPFPHFPLGYFPTFPPFPNGFMMPFDFDQALLSLLKTESRLEETMLKPYLPTKLEQ
mmetsp:Transcript_55054/g.63323  ORF Transcript_55054/g.63323 Transcript_55054/m.63323 type:complete len:328 (+) Transcript_55054:26-1009(+)